MIRANLLNTHFFFVPVNLSEYLNQDFNCSEKVTENKVFSIVINCNLDGLLLADALMSAVGLYSGRELSDAIVTRLMEAEAHELNPHLIDDLKIARQCVINAWEGVRDPWGYSFWFYVGITHQKFLKVLEERAARHAEMETTHGQKKDEAVRDDSSGEVDIKPRKVNRPNEGEYRQDQGKVRAASCGDSTENSGKVIAFGCVKARQPKSVGQLPPSGSFRLYVEAARLLASNDKETA